MKYRYSKLKIFFSKFAINKHYKRFVYAAIGDSTVEGIGASNPDRSYTSLIFSNIKTMHKNAQYHNFGKSGAKIYDVIKNQTESAISVKPDLISISIGANEILQHFSINDFRKNLLFLIESLKQEAPKATIIINSIPSFSLTPAVPGAMKFIANLQIKRFNKCIYEISKKTNIIHNDTYNQSTICAKIFPETFANDNFHPSDFGYAL
jgi:lysophospholipase L1-like esterase